MAKVLSLSEEKAADKWSENVFKSVDGSEYLFVEGEQLGAIVCCQKCDLYKTIKCQFAKCRYYERKDRRNGYFIKRMRKKRA